MSVALLPREIANALVRVRFAWGADLNANPATWVWSDVTTDVWFSGPVTITPMGRGDWASLAQPAQCTFRLNNETGAYSKGPGSQVRDNTPVQVQVSLNNGATWFTRFQGETPTFTPRWDANGQIPYVVVKAYGRSRRILFTKRTQNKQSPLTRAVLATTSATLRQFWPCEDGRESTQAASAFAGGVPLAPIGEVDFGVFDLTTQTPDVNSTGRVYGTDVLPQFKNGGRLVATFPAGSAASWTVQLTTFIDMIHAVGSTVTACEWQCDNSTFPRWQLIVDDSAPAFGVNSVRVMAISGAGVATQVAALPFDIAPAEFRIDAAQSGGNINVTLKGIAAPQGQVSTGTGSIAGTLGGVNGFTLNPGFGTLAADYILGHVRIWDGNSAPDFATSWTVTSAWTSWVRELATARLTRLCGEEAGLSIAITGTTATAMGPQGVDTLWNLLRECEAADMGLLYDGLGPGLGYVTRAAKYNQAAGMTLNGALHQFVDPFEPEDDDQRTVNLVTMKRKLGSQATYEQVTGAQGTATVGEYPTAPTVNIASDQPLYNLAGWVARLGTVESSYRYPTLNLDFGAQPSLMAAWIPSVPLGGRVDVTNASSAALQHPVGDLQLLLEGYQEKIAPDDYTAQLNLSFYDPWIVDALNQTFRLELAGQTLAANLNPGATSLSLATAAGHCLFTTNAQYPADFPLDLLVGGWRIHVTAASGGSSPQTLTISASPNTAIVPAGTPVRLLRPAALAL